MPDNKDLPLIGYRKILYVTDLSESGRQAFPHAASLAIRCHSELTVFHVVENRDLHDLLGYVNDELWEDLTKRSLQEAREILRSRKRDHVTIRDSMQQHFDDLLPDSEDEPRLTYEIKVESGDRLEKILEEAHGGGYDLLVISKHGNRHSVKDAVLGDTTRRIIRRCRIPVLVIPLNE